MVEPYTTQQFFDTPANITNGQLLALNQKFTMDVVKKLRKPITRKPNKGKGPAVAAETPRPEENELNREPIGAKPMDTAEVNEDDEYLAPQETYNSSKKDEQKSTALYCQAHIKNKEISLIVDSGSSGCIISYALLKELGMQIQKESKTIMINVNGERRKPMGMVTNIPLRIMGKIISFDAIVTETNSYDAIVGNDWLEKTDAEISYRNKIMTLYWGEHTIDVPIEFRQSPLIRTEQVDNDESEEEYEEEYEEESEEENEQEGLFCYSEEISIEEVQKIDKELEKPTTENQDIKECFYQYKEIEKGAFHTGRLTAQQLKRFNEFMSQYVDLFIWENDQFGRTNIITHSIDTGEAMPIKQRFYRTSYKNQEFIKEEIDRLLKSGLIQPSKSQWTSPVVVVEKKNGKKRLCVDYRKLNSVTKKDNYPLPRIDDMLETLEGSRWFTSLDLASGFWQVELDPKDREKTTFITRFGTYEFNVMPFGLCNAPATFQRLMDTVLRDILWQNVVVYIDDINIGTKTFDKHLLQLEQVFLRLRQAGLKLSPEKCFFFEQELPFLGHVISGEGIQTDPNKIAVMRNFPVPKDLTQLRGFIALTSYYRRFIKGFANIVEPLNRLFKKNTPFIWTQDQQDAFERLKRCLTSPPILAYPDFERPFILYTDASSFALGAILSQKDDQKRERVIAYASRTLRPPERKYSATEVECLAVVWAVQYYHHYLHGHKFTVITDHAALAYLKNMKNPVGRLGRWLMTFNSYDMEIINRPGKLHSNVDTLSRIQH